MAYKHAEVVKAGLDGKDVQQWYHGRWVDLGKTLDVVPAFHVADAYRIKPEPVKVVPYKRYVYRNCNGKLGVTCTWLGDDALAHQVEGGTFVKWIDTEWQEYVVEDPETVDD